MTAPIPLSEATLGLLAPRLDVPRYDRRALLPAVVHLSVGSFHRAHQAMYLDDLARRDPGRAWGVTGVGLYRPQMRSALAPQDGLYTVVARDAHAMEARVVGVITRYLYAPEEGAAVLAALTDPRTRLVTLTITADGYAVPQPGVEPQGPGAAIALLVEALERRRAAGIGAFTVLSCDNMPGNGEVARRAVVACARRRAPGLAAWIAAHATFPGSMVDRITPRTTDGDRALVAREFGVLDRWPVMTEPFSQWIVEDDFCAGRPALEDAGVHMVSDVRPYALMKTRLLNASHCALGHLGTLAGLTTTHGAMADPVLAAAVDHMMAREVAPLLPPVPGVDLPRYRASVLERLRNPAVGDTLARLCRNGSSKVPAHVLSSLAAARGAGLPHDVLTVVAAGWCRYLRGTDEHGRAITLDDPKGSMLVALARAGGDDPGPLLAEGGVFGELGTDEGFASELRDALRDVDARGVRGALRLALARRAPVRA